MGKSVIKIGKFQKNAGTNLNAAILKKILIGYARK